MEPRDRARRPLPSSNPHRRMLADFCSLSMRILRLASRGVSQSEFLQEALQLLVRFSGCDTVRLCLEEAGARSAWKGWLDGGDRFRIEPDDGAAEAPTAGDGSRLRLSFTVDARVHGMLELASRRSGAIREREVEFYEGLGQTLGVAISDRRAQWALRERVKELTCLYAIAQIIQQPERTVEELLQQIADVLPPAFQYPQVAAARIRLEPLTVASPGFTEGRFRLRSPILSAGGTVGEVEVHYAAAGLDSREDPFLPEERSLLDEVARRVAYLAESRRLEAQLRHADRLATIGELAAGVAHELNEPLANILGFAQLARKGPGLPEQVGQDLDRIVQASLHAREIVRKLLIFSRQMPTRKTTISLNSIVGDGLFFLESRCRKEGIELVRELDPGLPLIVADGGQLYQVLVNLVVNAMQAMPRGGRLAVRTRARPEEAVLVVEDTGEGMSEAVRRQIFLPFFTTKPVGRGTGLGLPVVHGIVASHGGRIEVWSREGEGSRFTVHLPAPAGGADENG